MRGKVFNKRPGIKETRKLLLDCQLASSMLACHRLEVLASVCLMQVSEAVYQAIICGDERHVLLYRHAGPLRLCSPLLHASCLQTRSRDREYRVVSGFIVTEFP